MKKLVLIATLLIGTASFDVFAKKDQEEVTLHKLSVEGISMILRGFLMYKYLVHCHEHIKPSKGDAALAEVFDMYFKSFCGALCINKAKSFFDKLDAYLVQKSKPLTDPALDALKTVI